jgi:hypothetical protein
MRVDTRELGNGMLIRTICVHRPEPGLTNSGVSRVSSGSKGPSNCPGRLRGLALIAASDAGRFQQVVNPIRDSIGIVGSNRQRSVQLSPNFNGLSEVFIEWQSMAMYSFIQKMRELAITSGCTATTYCPDNPTTRGQMAVFIIRAFLTP